MLYNGNKPGVRALRPWGTFAENDHKAIIAHVGLLEGNLSQRNPLLGKGSCKRQGCNKTSRHTHKDFQKMPPVMREWENFRAGRFRELGNHEESN